MNWKMEKKLADVTLHKKKIERQYTSSGIRELDEMLGGGFQKGTINLFQQDIGSGGEILFFKLIEIQLSLSNLVLVILTDPTATFLEAKLNQYFKQNSSISSDTGNNGDQTNENGVDNLIVLNLVEMSKKNSNIIFDKHEISLKIRDVRQKAVKKLKKMRIDEEDEDIELFTFFVTLNPLILNLSQENVSRIMFDLTLMSVDQNTIDLILMEKNILSSEMNARIQSMCHGVIDLHSYFKGIQKINQIRILKMLGRYYDVKSEPYVLYHDTLKDEFQFLIKSAFLTSFETFKNLINWNSGMLSLSSEPYMLIPINHVMQLLDMPYNLNKEKGLEEITEKGMGIGRNLAILVENLYFIEGLDLFKMSLQTASLLGWGSAELVSFEPQENLIKLQHMYHKKLSQKTYFAFLDGFYKGLVKKCFKKGVRYVKLLRIESESEKDGIYDGELRPLEVKVRLEKE